MTSSDLRDVLELGDAAGPRLLTKKTKALAPRPNVKGLAREVLNLGGGNPIAIVPSTSHFKKPRLASRKPAEKWELRPFRNSARQDHTLMLRHWRRKDSREPSMAEGDVEDSAFAKFNARVQVAQYTEEQYQALLQQDDWSKEETDYLMGLVGDFDLRWPLIWDRYEWSPAAQNGEADADGDESKAVVPASKPRSMEDLKARFYDVSCKMLVAQKPVQLMAPAEYALYEAMAHYNPKQEKVRKDFAIKTLSRSKEEAREEESLLLEIKRIQARSERFNEERRELYNRLDYPRAETDITPFKSSAGLQTLLQNLMIADKSKKRKSIMGADGVNGTAAGGGTAAAAGSGGQGGSAVFDSGKRDNAASSNAATRESTVAMTTPTTASKKGQLQEKAQPPERRKLNALEEAIYGATHHDKLGSGPTFRTERINKLFSHKSNQQQLRINNILNELDVPGKLVMPTAATTLQYEKLLGGINSLLDAKKVSDKLDAEVKIEQAKKAEREKHLPPAQGSAPTTAATTTADTDSIQSSAAQSNKGQSDKSAISAAQPGAQTNGDAAGSKADDGAPADLSLAPGDSATSPTGDTVQDKDDDDDKDDDNDKDDDDVANKGDDNSQSAPRGAREGSGDGDVAAIKSAASAATSRPAEAQQEQEKMARPAGSNNVRHKRSASIMSSVSDKSAKRQKK